jgi:uncharacterized protein YjbI with pentapeptide repeats
MSLPQTLGDALNSQDTTKADELFAAGAAVVIKLPSPLSRIECSGKRLLLSYSEFFRPGFHLDTPKGIEVVGNRVRWSAVVRADALHDMGIDGVEVASEASLRGGRIETLRLAPVLRDKLKNALQLYLLRNKTVAERTEIVIELKKSSTRLQLPQFCGMRADLKGLDMQAIDKNLTFADLRGAYLTDARLQNVDLYGATLSRADLGNANLHGAILRQAELRDAVLQEAELGNSKLTGANFGKANLVDANLKGTRLLGCNLHLAYFLGVQLDATLLHSEQFSEEATQQVLPMRAPAIGEEHQAKFGEETRRKRAQLYGEAKNAYLGLKKNFDDLGDFDGLSWAYRKERRMETAEAYHAALSYFGRLLGLDNRLPPITRKRGVFIWATVKNLNRFAINKIVEAVCDYGEGLWRVIATLVVVMTTFTLIYAVIGGQLRDDNFLGVFCGSQAIRDLPRLGLFSLMGMTARDTGALEEHSDLIKLLADSELVQFLAAIETITAIALAGLLGFVVGNRVRRS